MKKVTNKRHREIASATAAPEPNIRIVITDFPDMKAAVLLQALRGMLAPFSPSQIKANRVSTKDERLAVPTMALLEAVFAEEPDYPEILRLTEKVRLAWSVHWKRASDDSRVVFRGPHRLGIPFLRGLAPALGAMRELDRRHQWKADD